MKTLRNVSLAALSSLLLINQAAAQGINFGADKVQANIKGSNNTADVAGQNIVNNLIGFLALIAVAYGIYGGFLMLTAGGEDEKVKKGKTILIQVGLGLMVILLAWSIVSLILTKFFANV